MSPDVVGLIVALVGIVVAFGFFLLGCWYGRRSARPYDSWPIVTDEAASLRAQVGFLTHCLELCREQSGKRLAAIHRLQGELRQAKEEEAIAQ